MAKTFKLEKEILNNILQRKIISPYNSFETIDGEFFAGNYLCEKNGHTGFKHFFIGKNSVSIQNA